MRKKLSHNQLSMKISKNTDRRNFSSLITALKPKVYITDVSNFKQLVQELTGNESPIETCQGVPTCQTVSECEIIIRSEPGSTDISEGCVWDQPIAEGGYRVPLHDQDQVTANDRVLVECSKSLEQEADLDYYHLLESWLLDTEHNRYYHGYDQLGLDVEANIYECELLGQL